MRKHRRQHLTIKLWIVGDGQKASPRRKGYRAHQIILATWRVASVGLIESGNHKDFAMTTNKRSAAQYACAIELHI
ncbi:MAG: hypothetical protein ACI910_001544 [Oleispira sp.]|jgi:hypothetical protein